MTHVPVAERRLVVPSDSTHALRLVAIDVGARVTALAIDVGIFIIAAPFVLGLCAVVLRDYWPIGAVAVAALYVGGSWAASGKTLGMHLLGVRLVDERSGHPPSTLQVFVCTALTLPPLVGGAVLLNSALVPGPSAVPQSALLLSGGAFAMGLISMAFSFVDGGRMLHDRMCGVVTVREDRRASRAPAPR